VGLREGGREGGREGRHTHTHKRGREGGREDTYVDSQGLELVIVGGTGAVGIYIINISGLEARGGQSHVHGVGQPLAFGVGSSDMVGVTGGAVPRRKGRREEGKEGGMVGVSVSRTRHTRGREEGREEGEGGR